MPRRKALRKSAQPQSSSTVHPPAALPKREGLFGFLGWDTQVKLLVLLALLLYANTLFNGYALDDDVVIVRNTHVQKGLAGIFDLLNKDSFHGYLGKDTDFLPGGRYRPLSLVMFAIEVELFGKTPFIGHLVNVLLYGLTAWLVLVLLGRQLMPNQPDLAFLAALLFVIHPLHTEVVANIKSRDELLSLVLLLATFIAVFRALQTEGAAAKSSMIFAVGLYFLALLAKENGVMLVVLLPLTLYFFSSLKAPRIALATFPFVVILLLYLAIRTAVLGDNLTAAYEDDMTNPYLQATLIEKYATITYVQLKYLLLLVWPHPLSWDYSYPQIEFRNLTSLDFWVALAIIGGLFGWAVSRLRSRHQASWGLLFYFTSMALVANVVINIGAPMGERFAYQASLGFLVALAYLFLSGYQQIKFTSETNHRAIALGLLGLIAAAAAYQTINRNRLWRDSIYIALNDVKVCPRSAKTNMSAGDAFMALAFRSRSLDERIQYFRSAIPYYQTTLKLTPKWLNARKRIGESLYEQAKISDSLITAGNTAEFSRLFVLPPAIRPDSLAMILLDSSLKYDPLRHNAWSNLGHMYRRRDHRAKAIECYTKAIEAHPDTAIYWYQLGETWFELQQFDKTIYYFEEAVKREPRNTNMLYDLGVAYFNSQRYAEAKLIFERVLSIDSQHEKALAALQAAKKALKQS
jgi:tetratricopeptide (TPR) repeat protein